MAEQTLEFRGIRCEHLMNYFKELEAEQQTFAFPYVFHGPGWRADILREDQVRITSDLLSMRFLSVLKLHPNRSSRM